MIHIAYIICWRATHAPLELQQFGFKRKGLCEHCFEFQQLAENIVREDILVLAEGMLKQHMRRVTQGKPRAYPVLTGRSPGSTPFIAAEDIYHVSCASRECWFWAEYMLELWEKTNEVEEKWDRDWNKSEVWRMLDGKLTVEFKGQDRTGG